MEAKTLMRLIKDDIAHLEEITGEFLMESLPASDEVELALVRAKALLRELELLYKLALQHESISDTFILPEQPKIELQEHYNPEQASVESSPNENEDDEKELISIPVHSDFISEDVDQYTKLNFEDQQNTEESPEVAAVVLTSEEHFTALTEPPESVDVAPVSPIIEEEVDENITKMESDNFEPIIQIEDELTDLPANDIESNETVTDKTEEPIEELVEETVDKEEAAEELVVTIDTEAVQDIPEHSEEILAEEFKEGKKTLNETLGESHQMVNDILSAEKDETEYKILPLNSIWDGIGINDRFLFIRELFANSSAKLENTVTALDKLATIQDAVTYLKMNFKWNKTEASHKFLLLVKRRFTK